MSLAEGSLPCPLCGEQKTGPYWRDQRRTYLLCNFCRLVFVPRQFHLSPAEERAVYDLHKNDPLDAGYRKFLSRLSRPLLAKLASPCRGLDFGCGPGPALQRLFIEAGHSIDLYDPFYYNDRTIFEKRYDFICATEVVEHLHMPKETFAALFGLLRPGGWLAIMTKLARDPAAFQRWHYIRDPTHICFYSRSTFAFLAQWHQAGLEIIGNDVILMQKR